MAEPPTTMGYKDDERYLDLLMDNALLPDAVLYSLLGVMGLAGFLGNVLACALTRHPQLKVRDLGFALFLLEDLNPWPLCGVYNCLQGWFGDLTLLGLLAFTFDRYVATVLTSLKARVCKRKRAAVLCVTLTLVTCLINAALLESFGLVTSRGRGSLCYRRVELAPAYFSKIALLRLLPSVVVVCLAAHNGVVLIRSRSSVAAAGIEERPTNGDFKEEDWPLMAVTATSIVTRLPRELHQLLTRVLFYQAATGNFSIMEAARSIFRAEDVLAVITSVHLGCTFYVMVIASPLYRKLMREIMQKIRSCLAPPARIVLPDDRREFTLRVDGSVIESNTNQIVDLYAYARQTIMDRAQRPPSITSSLCSGSSSHTEIEDQEDVCNVNFTLPYDSGAQLESIQEGDVTEERHGRKWSRGRKWEGAPLEKSKSEGFEGTRSRINWKRKRAVRSTTGREGALMKRRYAKKSVGKGDTPRSTGDVASSDGSGNEAGLNVSVDGGGRGGIQDSSATEGQAAVMSCGAGTSDLKDERSSQKVDHGKDADDEGDEAADDQGVERRSADGKRLAKLVIFCADESYKESMYSAVNDGKGENPVDTDTSDQEVNGSSTNEVQNAEEENPVDTEVNDQEVNGSSTKEDQNAKEGNPIDAEVNDQEVNGSSANEVQTKSLSLGADTSHQSGRSTGHVHDGKEPHPSGDSPVTGHEDIHGSLADEGQVTSAGREADTAN